MVWKQDLAKLKQAFRESGGPPPPIPKPKPKPTETKSLNDEDAMFLAAMGTPAAKPSPQVAPEPTTVPAPVGQEVSFEAGLSDLKGLKPMAKAPVLLASVEPPKVAESRPEAALTPGPATPDPTVSEAQESRPEEAPSPAKVPVRIQLAAGMAVEVDGSLDLRGHSVGDAIGRLRDRIEDGAIMGWRTLHVTLGEDAALHEALLGFLAGGQAPRIGRYAQAPIPMGGVQAWVLYY